MPASLETLTARLLFCLLYWHLPASAHSQNGSVFCMSRDGSSIEPISVEKVGWGTFSPRWCSDGKRLLYHAHSGNDNEFHLLSVAGEKQMEIPVPAGLTSVAGLTWSPDCIEIALAGMEGPKALYDLYVLKLPDKEQSARRIVLDGLHPAWSPSGDLLAFSTFRDGNFEVYVVDKEGMLRNLTRHEGYDGRPSWSPDGARIAFESARFGNLQICIVDVASGEVIQVTDHPFGHNRQPAWSPDGMEIVFVSNRNGKSSIYRMAADGTGVTKLTSGYDEDWEPAWSPDGESICFVSNRAEPFLDGLHRWFSGWLTDW